jgi:hypothetical protein
MAPDPKEWKYNGKYEDTKETSSQCACGHAIRYIFTIERMRDGATLPIGSTCIASTVPFLKKDGAFDLAKKLEKAYKKHLQKLAKSKKQKRDKENADQVKLLIKEARLLIKWYNELQRNIFLIDIGVGKRFYLPTYFSTRKYTTLIGNSCTTPGRTLVGLKKRINIFKKEADSLGNKLRNSKYYNKVWVDYPEL